MTIAIHSSITYILVYESLIPESYFTLCKTRELCNKDEKHNVTLKTMFNEIFIILQILFKFEIPM